MVRAIMHGCNGHMGQVITGLIKNDESIEIVAGIDKYNGIENVIRCLTVWKHVQKRQM